MYIDEHNVDEIMEIIEGTPLFAEWVTFWRSPFVARAFLVPYDAIYKKGNGKSALLIIVKDNSACTLCYMALFDPNEDMREREKKHLKKLINSKHTPACVVDILRGYAA